MRTSFTKFRSKHGFGKSVELVVDRELPTGHRIEKKSVIHMSEGSFETVECEWSEFGGVLAGLKPGEALAYGVCRKVGPFSSGKPLSEGRIVTRAVEERLDATGDNLNAVARTRPNFTFHTPGCPGGHYNILYIDIDTYAWQDELPSVEEATEKLLDLFPALKSLEGGCWAFASAGADIFDVRDGGGGVKLKGLSGLHVYFLVPRSISILYEKDKSKSKSGGEKSKIADYFNVKMWLNGTGRFDVHEHKYGASCLERGFVDLSVWQPERFDFVGGSKCGPGLEQRREPPVLFDTFEVVDRGAVLPSGTPRTATSDDPWTISDEDRALAAANRQAARDKAQGEARKLTGFAKARVRADGEEIGDRDYWRIAEENKLPGNVKIRFDTGEIVPVWKLIFFPEEYSGKYCCDPLEPDLGTKKAHFFFNPDSGRGNRYVIASFLHGGQIFTLRTDADGVRSLIKSTDSEVLGVQVRNDSRWQEELGLVPEEERGQLLDMLKDRKVATKSEIAAKIEVARFPRVERKKKGPLEKMNERFAYVTISGKARYVEDTGKELIVRSKSDFISETEALDRIEVVSDGKVKSLKAPDAWLEWGGRRAYPGGMRFAPGETPREFKDRDTGNLVLNRYRGFSVDGRGPEDRKCKGERCNGVGCVAWCLAELEAGRDGLCEPEVGGGSEVCYWVRTVHDVACAGVLGHTKWVIDWFADILQAPGGRGADAKRTEVSLCLRGPQGAGKNSIVDPVMDILGDYSYTVTDMTRITNNFNAFMQDMLLLFANEAVWGGSKKEGNKLKDLITGQWIDVEYKGIDAFKVRSYIRLFLASNSDWVVPAEDDERRYTVFNVTEAHVKDRAWFGRVKAMRCEDLLWELLSRGIESNLYVNLETEALLEQKGYGRGVVEDFISTALDENWFWDLNGVGVTVTHSFLKEKFQERFSGRRSYAENPETFQRKFRKLLKDKGVELPLRVRDGKTTVGGFYMPPRSWFFQAFPWLETELGRDE
jgi:hypothetical protein